MSSSTGSAATEMAAWMTAGAGIYQKLADQTVAQEALIKALDEKVTKKQASKTKKGASKKKEIDSLSTRVAELEAGLRTANEDLEAEMEAASWKVTARQTQMEDTLATLDQFLNDSVVNQRKLNDSAQTNTAALADKLSKLEQTVADHKAEADRVTARDADLIADLKYRVKLQHHQSEIHQLMLANELGHKRARSPSPALQLNQSKRSRTEPEDSPKAGEGPSQPPRVKVSHSR